MSYVDAGYAIALSVLFLYAVALVARRRRLSRAAARAAARSDARSDTSRGAGPAGATTVPARTTASTPLAEHAVPDTGS